MGFGFGKFLGRGKRGHIKEKWRFDSKTSLLAPPTVCDLEGSGQNSILFGTNNGKLYCLDREGNIKWVFESKEQVSQVDMMFLDTETAKSIESSPGAYDINGDKKKEVLFGSEMGIVFALSHEGKLLWKFKAEGSVRGDVIARDVNNDGKLEVIFGSGDKHLYILSNTGELLHKHKIDSPIESTPETLGNKIVFGSNDGTIYCLNYEGHQEWKVKTNGKVVAQPAISQILEDSIHYTIIGSVDQNLYMINESGEVVWKFKTGGAIYSRVSLADIDNDKKTEIIFGSCDNNVYALRSNGDKMWSYETDFWVVAPVIVGDIDNDGQLEIIAGSYDHNIYILDARGKYMLDYIPGLAGVMQQTGSYSDIMTSEPGKITGKKIWQYQTEGVVVGCAFVNETNIIVNTRTGKVNDLMHE